MIFTMVSTVKDKYNRNLGVVGVDITLFELSKIVTHQNDTDRDYNFVFTEDNKIWGSSK